MTAVQRMIRQKPLIALIAVAIIVAVTGLTFMVLHKDSGAKFQPVNLTTLKPLPGSTELYDLRSLAQSKDDLAIANAVMHYCQTKVQWSDGKNNGTAYAASFGVDNNTVHYFDGSSNFVRKGNYVNMAADCYRSDIGAGTSVSGTPNNDVRTSFYLYKTGGTWKVVSSKQNGYPDCSASYKGQSYPDCKFQYIRS